MESKVLKLMAQLGLLAVVIWAIAAASGRRDMSGSGKKGRRMRGVWSPSIVDAPMAQASEYVPAAVGPLTTY